MPPRRGVIRSPRPTVAGSSRLGQGGQPCSISSPAHAPAPSQSQDVPLSPSLTTNDGEHSQSGKRKWSSPVWNHYEIEEGDQYKDGIPRAICKYCKGGPKIANPANGTSNFKRHTETCPSRSHLDVGQMVLANTGMLPRKIDHIVYKDMVALAIIRHGYPFTFAEHEGNRSLHLYLNPDCKPVSRNTAKNHVMKIHKREQQRLKEFMLSLPGKICLTCDMWTSVVVQGYLSLTAHYVDAEWNLHAKILNFCHVQPPHTAAMLHDTVFSLLKEWGIHKKIFTVTLDNARCNDSMQDMLADSLSLVSSLPCGGDYFHVRCGAHILNLIVQEGLNVIVDGVRKIRKLVNYVTSSERRAIMFRDNALAAGIDCSQNLRLDCPTRWNSTYTMLQRALKYRAAFSNIRRMERVDSSCPPALSDEEWSRVQRICALLKPFDDITTLMSGRNYPTSNLYLRSVWKIELLLLSYVGCDDVFLSNMAVMMKIKFDKYWESYSLILSFAAMLDPRYKFDFVEYCFGELDATTAAVKSNRVKTQFYRLFNEYVTHAPEESATMDQTELLEDLDGFANFGATPTAKSQLDLYLNEYKSSLTEELNVLMWWKNNEKRFPILAAMARDILAIPITTVASESAFSLGSRVLTKWRSSLHPETANALLTTRSWIFGFDVEEAEEEKQETQGLEVQLTGLKIVEDEDKDEA